MDYAKESLRLHGDWKGKIEVVTRVPVENKDDLSLAYTPGVAPVSYTHLSGEGKDRRRVEGDYYLSRREREDIRFLDAQKIPTVLILNSGGPVELTDILEETENICAVLNISQLGQRGGLALANVLLGKVTPGGKLTATWARRYEMGIRDSWMRHFSTRLMQVHMIR